MMTYDAFISHSSNDAACANSICSFLEENGIRCWIAPRDIVPGDKWASALVDSISASRFLVLLLSKYSNSSEQVHREVLMAAHRGLILITVRLDNVEPAKYLEYFLGVSQWLDARMLPFSQHLKTLLAVIAAGNPNQGAALSKRKREKSQLPDPDVVSDARYGFRVEIIATFEVLRIIQEEVVPAIFGGDSPPKEEIYAAYRPGTKRSVALYSELEKRYVGFASCWPLTDEAANRIMSGKITENDLTRNDILDSNESANYALIPGIGVRDMEPTAALTAVQHEARGAYILVQGFKKFVRDQFLQDETRKITIIATGYSEAGIKWCDKLKMSAVGEVRFEDGKRHPIYSKRFSRDSLEYLFE